MGESDRKKSLLREICGMTDVQNYDPKFSHFDIDMKRGRNGELFVDDIIKMLAEGSGQIEVKNDRRFIDTYRYYVEYACRGRDGIWRPSGIRVTTAKFWAIVWGEQKPDRLLPAVFIIETDWLKRAVRSAYKDENQRLETIYGENPTKGVGVNLQHIIENK